MKKLTLSICFSVALVTSIVAAPFSFTTGTPDGRLATGSRPSSTGKIEIESADDFVITNNPTRIDSATFTGLLPAGATIGEVRVEIYHVFPADSDIGRTSGPPTFSTSQVPTRVNSPSDVEFADRDTATGNLTFTTTLLNASFTASNSILNGINPSPNQHTSGEGPVTGQEVQFNVNFTTPFNLPADHYFFVPQVEVTNGGDFFWLSVARPIVAPGTPFPAGFTDLQAWIRNENLAPDWLREGTDIIGGGPPAPTFNEAFSLSGTVPDAGSTALLLGSAATVLFYLRRRIRA